MITQTHLDQFLLLIGKSEYYADIVEHGPSGELISDSLLLDGQQLGDIPDSAYREWLINLIVQLDNSPRGHRSDAWITVQTMPEHLARLSTAELEERAHTWLVGLLQGEINQNLCTFSYSTHPFCQRYAGIHLSDKSIPELVSIWRELYDFAQSISEDINRPIEGLLDVDLSKTIVGGFYGAQDRDTLEAILADWDPIREGVLLDQLRDEIARMPLEIGDVSLSWVKSATIGFWSEMQLRHEQLVMLSNPDDVAAAVDELTWAYLAEQERLLHLDALYKYLNNGTSLLASLDPKTDPRSAFAIWLQAVPEINQLGYGSELAYASLDVVKRAYEQIVLALAGNKQKDWEYLEEPVFYLYNPGGDPYARAKGIALTIVLFVVSLNPIVELGLDILDFVDNILNGRYHEAMLSMLLPMRGALDNAMGSLMRIRNSARHSLEYLDHIEDLAQKNQLTRTVDDFDNFVNRVDDKLDEMDEAIRAGSGHGYLPTRQNLRDLDTSTLTPTQAAAREQLLGNQLLDQVEITRGSLEGCVPTSCVMLIDSVNAQRATLGLQPYTEADLANILSDIRFNPARGADMTEAALPIFTQTRQPFRTDNLSDNVAVATGQLTRYSQNGPMLVEVQTLTGRHVVVVDAIAEIDGTMWASVRDPNAGEYLTPLTELASDGTRFGYFYDRPIH